MGNFVGWYGSTTLDGNENGGYSISEYDDGIVQDANLTVETTGRSYKHFEQVIEEKITYNLVTNLEKNLDTCEKVSLIFLLCDSTDVLEILNNIITSDSTDVNITPLSNWAKKTPPKWKQKLVEALGIIQNYKELASLGFNKTDVDGHFYTYIKEASVYVNKFRKFLFKFCESFTREDSKRLIDHIKVHSGTSPCSADEVYLEIHLLSWINQGYISIDDKKPPDLKFLISQLKQLDLLDKASEIENIAKLEESESEKIYSILDHRAVGMCLIINQRDFYADRRPEFANKADKKLDKREGTDIDCKSLCQTFQNFNISVHLRHNVKHDEMKSEIISAVRNSFKDNHSMFILCILSHGAEGAVYGSNGVLVEIDSIEKWLTVNLHSKLKGKPKVLIIQACQGNSIQTIDDDDDVDDDVDTDAPHPKQQNDIASQKPCDTEVVPKLCDILTCQAVVPGYVALRDKNKGSIYIQNLCNELNKSGKKKDLMSIMIDVNYCVNQIYHLKHGVMTPRFTVQLRKKLYLVPVNKST